MEGFWTGVAGPATSTPTALTSKHAIVIRECDAIQFSQMFVPNMFSIFSGPCSVVFALLFLMGLAVSSIVLAFAITVLDIPSTNGRSFLWWCDEFVIRSRDHERFVPFHVPSHSSSTIMDSASQYLIP